MVRVSYTSIFFHFSYRREDLVSTTNKKLEKEAMEQEFDE
jgi:hypothetical protein